MLSRVTRSIPNYLAEKPCVSQMSWEAMNFSNFLKRNGKQCIPQMYWDALHFSNAMNSNEREKGQKMHNQPINCLPKTKRK